MKEINASSIYNYSLETKEKSKLSEVISSYSNMKAKLLRKYVK